jgi:hypothetical protein
METIEGHIEFCILSFQQNGYLKWNFKNYQQFNSNILFKGCYDLTDSYIKNELEYDIKAFKSLMKVYSADLNYSLVGNEFYIEIKR